MARIPVYQERQQASGLMRVPELRVPDAGGQAMGRAAQQMGQALGQTARVTNDIYQENSKAWASETASNEVLHWTQRSEELKGMAGQGGAGYTQMLNQEYQKRANELLAQAPDDASRNYLAQNLNEFRRNLISNGMKFEVTESRVYRVESQKKAVTNLAAAVYQNPDPEYAQQAIGQQHAVYDSLNLPPSVTAELKEYASTAITGAYFQSLAKNNPAALNVMMSQYSPVVTSKADKEKLFGALTWAESSNNPNAVGRETRFGRAVGLAQVLPTTAMDPGVKLSDGSNMPNVFEVAKSKGVKFKDKSEESAIELLKNEEVGAEVGFLYFDAMLARYDGDPIRALAGYNWGIKETDNWDGDFNNLPEETKKYIPKVMRRAGIKLGSTASVENPLIANLPLADRITLMDTARENESAQIVESMALSVFDTFGPQTDTDAVELDIMNGHIDRVMAGNTPEERENAKALVSQYASAHNASVNQRKALRESSIWQQVLDNKSIGDIQASPEWGNLDGKTKASLIGQINTFRTTPTSPAQWAAYSKITGDPAELAKMSTEEILSMTPILGNELTRDLIKVHAKLNSPEGQAQVEYDEDIFKVYASKAGLAVYQSNQTEAQKEKIGKFRYAVNQRLSVMADRLKRPLSEKEKEDAMTATLNDMVYKDGLFSSEQVPVTTVEKDDMGDTYVMVDGNKVYTSSVSATERIQIIKALRANGQPVNEAEIVEAYVEKHGLPNQQPREYPEPRGGLN